MFNLRWKGCSKDLWILGGQLRPWENWSHLLSFLLVPGWQILFRKSLCHGVWRGSLSLKKTQVPTVASRLGKWNSRYKAFGIYTGSTTIWYIISNSILHCVTNTCSYLIKLVINRVGAGRVLKHQGRVCSLLFVLFYFPGPMHPMSYSNTLWSLSLYFCFFFF